MLLFVHGSWTDELQFSDIRRWEKRFDVMGIRQKGFDGMGFPKRFDVMGIDLGS